MMLVVLVSVLLGVEVQANAGGGVITRIDGRATLFSHPGTNAEAGPSPRVKFEGRFYTARQAKVGDKVESGVILRTAPNAKVRVVFSNGDSMNVGPSTSYTPQKKGSGIRLRYGKIRSIVSKKGPRKRMRIQTQGATMGVRGTDFFVSKRGVQGRTEVSVLRGAVEVQPESKSKKSAAKKVEKGQTMKVPSATEAAAVSEAPAVYRTTKQELVAIQKTTTPLARPNTDVAKEIQALEIKSRESTLEDIKDGDPKLYEQLKKSKEPVDVNQTVVSNLFKQAPEGPKDKKPFGEDLELKGDAYQKYFKIGN